MSFGGDLVRMDATTEYAGPGGDVEMLGLYFADAGQHLEHRLFVDHNEPRTRSHVTYKGALQGEGAHAVWIGNVLIRKEAEGIETYEENRNLVLTDGCQADSVPNLEIETGEIEGAGHASATGRFDDEQLFYLRSRGIEETEARRLVVHGFFNELVRRIAVPEIAAEPDRHGRGRARQDGRRREGCDRMSTTPRNRSLRSRFRGDPDDLPARLCARRARRGHTPERRASTASTVALVREGDDVFAIEDECSHAAVALSEGDVEGCTIECWMHGSRFDLRTGKPTGPPATEPVPVYPVRIDGDDVLIDLDTPRETTDMATLEIKDLHVSVDTEDGPKEILKGVDLTIRDGETHAIMGPNGSGKSTLAYSIAGHPKYNVTSGSVTLDGADVLAMSVDERARAGLFLAMQYPVEVPGVSVSNFLRTAKTAIDGEAPKLRTWVKDVNAVMERVKMDPDFSQRSVNEGFSGGEKKRHEIVQLELLDPKVAVLDETDSGLDIDALKIVSEGVNRFKEKGDKGVLLITHYTRILRYITPDFVHVFVDGRVAEEGGRELADQLEAEGYDKYVSAAAS